MPKFFIKTFGCQMNKRDSEKAYCIFEDAGFEYADAKDADVIVINSCAVREKAENKLYSEIGRIRSKNKKAKIISMGCVAQYNYERLKSVSDFVVCTNAIDAFYDIVDNLNGQGVYIKDKMNNPNHIFPHKKSVSAFIDIMYGCNNFCTYCIVPYTRGREVSRKKEAIIEEIKGVVDNGAKEVVLLGQNVNSYADKNCTFVDLLYDINKIDGLERIRFTTSHPKDFSYRLIEAMRDLNKVCEHIHLPLQSGSDRILKLMHRGYTVGEYLEKVSMFKESIKNASITTDIMVGFPSETDEDFLDTVSVMNKLKYDTSFLFKYSKRPFTKAKDMEGQIDERLKLDRLNYIQELQANITKEKNLEDKGKNFEVLIEGISKKGNMFFGRTRQNKVVNLEISNKIDIGDIVEVKITESLKHSLLGEVKWKEY